MQKYIDPKLTDPITRRVYPFAGIDITWAIKRGYVLANVEQTAEGLFYEEGFKPDDSYQVLRAQSYDSIYDQLDCLYHDIDNGLLGTKAKSSTFYQNRKSIKDLYPKPVEPEIEEDSQELES